MNEKNGSTPWLVVTILILALLPIAYVAGYFLRCESQPRATARPIRVYSSEWETILFQPAAKIESFLTGERILIGERVHPP